MMGRDFFLVDDIYTWILELLERSVDAGVADNWSEE
jgi:hypothetical protein